MQKSKQMLTKLKYYFTVASKGIAFSLLFILGFFLVTTAVKAEEPAGAINNIMVKEFPVKYHESTGTINGEAVIGNFSDQSFHNLSYKLELLAYGKDIDLGIIVHEEIAPNNFSIQGQGEVRESFSYEIPKGVPSGDYNFVFRVIDSRGRPLGFDSYPFSYFNNSSNLITVDSESIKIEVNKKNHHWREGPNTKKGDEVKLKFELTNNNKGSITNTVPHLTVYPYTPSFDKVKETDLESFSLKAGETKQFSYSMPELTNPQSYLAIIELKKDNQLIALPIRGRWVVEGIQGKIFTSGIDNNNNLTLEVIGSPFSEEESGTAIINVLDENGNLCFSQEKKITEMGAGTQIVSLPINFQQQCNNPTLKVSLKIKGKTVDTYEKKLDSDSVKSMQIAITSREGGTSKRTIALFLLIIPAIAIVITLIGTRDKKKVLAKRKVIVGLLLLMFLGVAFLPLLSVREIKAWIAEVGHYESIGKHGWLRYKPSQDKIKIQQQCLNAKNNYCHVGTRLGIERANHVMGFNIINWQKPYHNQTFKTGENVLIAMNNINNWCLNGVDMPTTIKWVVYSRADGTLVDSDSISIDKSTADFSQNIGDFDSGKYALYANIYFYHGSNISLLYHGMIRHFEVRGCDCSDVACYENEEDLLANDSFCTRGDYTALQYHSTASANISPWTWTWDCNWEGYTKEDCKAYKAPQCGTAINQPSSNKPTINLCGIGEASEVESNITNNTWDWTCGNGSCESVNCSATQRPPS
ncbi:MAG: hypothetical protein U9Q72_02030, partial [Patescibacteria group bacterium]|nr:hypothetical protein [Patescibacteria group bacterium]